MAPSLLTRRRVLDLLLLLLPLFPTYITARDIRVDDADPTFFTFLGEWNTIAPDHPCDTCEAVPDVDRIFMKTFRDGNAGRGSGTVKFRGSAISLFGIGVNLHGQGDLEYRIDDGPISRSSIPDDRTLNFRYDELLGRVENLDPAQEHTLAFNPALEQTHRGGLIFVDYAVITVPDESISTSSSSRTTATTSRTTSRAPTTTSEQPTTTADQTSSRGASSTDTTRNSSTVSTLPDVPSIRQSESTSGQAAATTSESSSVARTRDTDPINPTERGVNIGALVGGIVGGLALIALTLFLLFCRRRRQKVRLTIAPDTYSAAPQAFGSYSAVPASDRGSTVIYPPSDRLTAHRSDTSLQGSARLGSPPSSASLSASPLQHQQSTHTLSTSHISPFQQTFPTTYASSSAASRGSGKASIIAPPAPVQVIADEALLNRVRELEDQLAEANSRPTRRDTTRTTRSELPPPYA